VPSQRQARYEARLRAGVALYPAPLGAVEIDALVALGWLPEGVPRLRAGEAAAGIRDMAALQSLIPDVSKRDRHTTKAPNTTCSTSCRDRDQQAVHAERNLPDAPRSVIRSSLI
jgi:hypothetical protein